MLSYRTLTAEAALALSDAGVENAAYDASVLLMEAFGIDRVHLLMDQDRALAESEATVQTDGKIAQCLARFRKMTAQRAARVPLQQILGYAWFCGVPFFVNEHVLTPRQDTEVLVEQVLSDYKAQHVRVLDMCTGSGCIALSLAELGGYEQVCAVDVSAKALCVAAENARRLGFCEEETPRSAEQSVREKPAKQAEKNACETFGRKVFVRAQDGKKQDRQQRLYLVQSDLFAALAQDICGALCKPFDVLVSNPPYICSAVVDTLEPEVRVHEPRLALDGHADGLYFYRKIAAEAGTYLADGGQLYLEIGFDQGEAVSRLLLDAGYEAVSVVKDLAGLDRVVRARKPKEEKC